MSADTQKSDLVVIGAGPGGYAAALRAADLGTKVTLIDKRERPGGVCLHCGCIPSKTLLHTASFIHDVERAKEWGISVGDLKVDVEGVRSHKEKTIDRLSRGALQMCEQRGIDYVQGAARFVDANTVEVDLATGETTRIIFENAIVATGSEVVQLPELSEHPFVITSTEALALEEIPERLLVVGAGYIGVEMGQVYAALGSEVTMVEMTSSVLPSVDPELVKVLTRSLKKQFAALHLNTKVAKVEIKNDEAQVQLEQDDSSNQNLTFDKVLVAVGRRPLTTGLELEQAGVQPDDKGFIQVDDQQRTKVDHVFALGDVCGGPMLAHKATHEGRVAAEVIAGQKTVFEPRAIPMVVYSDPEIATVGASTSGESESDEILRFPWTASGRAASMGRTDGLTKLRVDVDTGRVRGVGLVGAGAGELIAEAALAIEMGAVAEDLALTIHAHPTLSETLMEAAQSGGQ